MEQNNYLEFEKSKAAVYTIMEAFFQDVFDLEDAFSEQKEFMCSPDLRDFIEENHLDLSLDDFFAL